MTTTESAAPAARTKYFEQGEHVALRPVLPEDFAELARLMSQTPCLRRPGPQTAERLRAKYEDGDEPGMWGERARTYSVLIPQQKQLVGYISESLDYPLQMLCISFELDHLHPRRGELGLEMLRTYMRYLQRWRNEQHLICEVLEVEGEKIAWLSACGFERELVQRRAELYRGEVVDRVAYGHLSDELKSAPSWSEGEPDYSRAVRPVRE